MTIEEQMAEVLRRLAESEDARASLMRMLERQGYQLDRMQDQLEQALKEAAALRRQLNRPPPDEPTPTPPAGGAPEGPPGTATPEPPIPSPPPRVLTPTLPRPHLPTLTRHAPTRNAADGHIGPPTA